MNYMKAKRTVLVLLVVILAAAGGYLAWRRHDDPRPTGASSTSGTTRSSAKPAGFDKTHYSLTNPASLWVVVDKLRPLSPKTYAPQLVVPDIPLRGNITGDEKHVGTAMAGPLEAMVAAAKQQGITLNLQSGYRSYNFQVTLYNSYVKQQGQAVADTQSARPGYSEHQTGLAADLGGVTQPGCNVAQCFANTVEGKWLARSAYKYGFIIRYPNGLDHITGYEYEPWHVRYVGIALSTEMHKEGIQTLEQFFGLPAAPDYQ